MMKFKVYCFIVLLPLTSNFLFSQYYPAPKRNNDIETLEKLNSMMEKDKSRELSAKQNVLAFRTEVRAEIRQVIPLLTQEQHKEILRKENLFWQMATENLKYSRSYEDFYRNYYSHLVNYKDIMLDSIAKIVND